MKRSIITAISIGFIAAACLAEIAGEHPVSSPAYGPPPGYRQATASASDGHDFLVAWVDTTRSRGYSYVRIYATRINASGQVLDPLGIRIPTLTTTITTNPTQLNVVYLGNAYLVCWNEGDASVSTSTGEPLVGVRISSQGQLLDSTPRVFAEKARLNTGGVASNGSRAVIAYTTPIAASPRESLMTLILDRDANIVDGPRTIPNPDGTSNETVFAASNGRGFLVVRTFGNVSFTATTALDANGAPLPDAPLIRDTPGPIFGLASDADSYVGLFEAPGKIGAQHFGSSGEILETSLFPLQQILPDYYRHQQSFQGFVFNGDSYLFMDGDPTQKTLGVRRLTRAGQLVGGYIPIAKASGSFSTTLWATTLASNSSSAFAGWVELQARNQIFSGSVIEAPSLAASAPFVIARAAATQIAPDAATSGTNTAIVWNEGDGVYAGRLTLDGQMLDGRGIRISALSPNTSIATQPSIAFDGANYIIAWIENPPNSYDFILKVARLAPGTGAILDPNGIAIYQNAFGAVALSSSPNGTLMAWAVGTNKILATILARDLSHGPAVTVNPLEQIGGGNISAAWNGSEWLLAWIKPVYPPDGGPICDPTPCFEYQTYAARLSSQLTLLDPASIVVSTTAAGSNRPLVASDGDGFLVAWSGYGDYDYTGQGGYLSAVFAQRISRDGTLAAPINGVRLAAGQVRSIAWDGLQYDIAFSARRYPPYSAWSFTSHMATLNVTHVAAHGAIESLAPLTVVTDLSDPEAALIVTGTGRVAIAYTRVASEPEYGDVERVFVSAPHALRGRAAR
ncbi:MAG: hypothetical protein QOC81_1026 [Thermoanaerobaculia bacterium]|jgi:hypothetical protein|nr:hypothetical protein [Thermoanaerobaculia bacterium]